MSVNIRQTAFAISRTDQTDLVTAQTATLFRPTKINQQMAEVKLNTESDAQDLGKDDEFATQNYLTNWDTAFQIECFTTSEMAAFAFAFGLGSSVSAIVGAGPGYTHTATPQTSGIDLPSFTYIERLPADGSYLDRMLLGCVVNGWTLQLNSGVGRQSSKLIIDVVGTGNITEPSGTGALPSAAALHGLGAGSAAITIHGTNYISGKLLVSLEAGWRNNVRLDSGFFPGSGEQGAAGTGAIRGRMEHGDREAYLRFVARLSTSSPEFALLLSQATGSAAVTLTGAAFTGGNHALSLTFPLTSYAAAVVDAADGIATVNVECSVLKGGSPVLTAVATNEVQFYGIEA